MNCNVCKCKTCKYNNECEYPAYYNCGHYIPNNENNKKTNGDMIKALYPKIHKIVFTDYYTVKVFGLDSEKIPCEFLTDWWNAPYKKGENNESNL